MSLHLEKPDAVVELLADGLLLVLAHRGSREGADGVAVVRTDVGDVGVETAAERGVSVANARALCQFREGAALRGLRQCTGELGDEGQSHSGAEQLVELEHG